jgi:hypothetical protein
MIATILLSDNVSQAKVNFKMAWLDEKQMLAIIYIYIYIIMKILAGLEFIFNNIIPRNYKNKECPRLFAALWLCG